MEFYSHVNYSVTKMGMHRIPIMWKFYSHVNYSVTKIQKAALRTGDSFTVT